MAFTKKEITQMLDALRDRYPEAGCALVHQNTYQLLISVVLSAQTTDKSVNKVTGELFAKYPSPADLAEADQQDVIDIIKTIGMYKTKSRNIIAWSRTKNGQRSPRCRLRTSTDSCGYSCVQAGQQDRAGEGKGCPQDGVGIDEGVAGG